MKLSSCIGVLWRNSPIPGWHHFEMSDVISLIWYPIIFLRLVIKPFSTPRTWRIYTRPTHLSLWQCRVYIVIYSWHCWVNLGYLINYLSSNIIRTVTVRYWVCWCLGAGYCFDTYLHGNCWWTGTGMWHALQGVCISIRGQSDVHDRSSCICQVVLRPWPAGCWCPALLCGNSHWLHMYELSLTWDAGHPRLCVISLGTHSGQCVWHSDPGVISPICPTQTTSGPFY